MNQIPPNVAVVFVSDIRFKMDIYKSLRNHYKIVSKITKAVTVDMIKGKIRERNDSLGDHQVQALESFRFETEEISKFQFMKEVARAERHVLVSFANLLYK